MEINNNLKKMNIKNITMPPSLAQEVQKSDDKQA